MRRNNDRIYIFGWTVPLYHVPYDYEYILHLSFLTADSTLEFEVEVISLSQQTPWQKLVNDILPLLCLALVPTLLGLVGLYLYNKAHAQPHGKKKSKDKKSKKK